MSKSKKQTTKKSAAKTATKTTGKAKLKTAGTSTSKTSLKPATRKAVPAAPLKAGATAMKNQSLTPEITITLNHDQIAKRAFAIWVAKGRPSGQDEQNWREAEQALTRDVAKRA